MKFILWLVTGLMLGPSLFSLHTPGWFHLISQCAGGLFLFFAGWEMRFLNLKTDRHYYLLLFLGCFIIPVTMGWFFFANLFMAMAIGISALPVAIQILKEKGLYNSDLSRRAITLASLCDLGAWIALAWLLPSSSVSAWILSHWIVMAFFVGLILGRFYAWPSKASLALLQAWVLAPLFFIGLGWKIDLVNLFEVKVFFEVLVLAVTTKSLGSYFFSRWAGASPKESWNLAAILNARGAMEILAANFAFQGGIITGGEFSALVLLGILTSMMAIPLVRK